MFQTVVVLLLTVLERKTLSRHEDGETAVQTDALLYVCHTLLMEGILEEICLLLLGLFLCTHLVCL